MAVFNTTEQQNAFKDALREMYRSNEAPNPSQWYSFSNAGIANSGYSFGQAQWDVGGNPEARAFLATLVDADGTRAFSDAEIESLRTGIIGEPALNTFSAILADHKTEINTFFEQKLNNDVQLIENIVSELRASGDAYQAQVADYITNSRDVQMLLADYNNQYPNGISGVDGVGDTSNDGLMMKYLKGLSVTPDGTEVRPDGEFSLSDLVRYLVNTKQAHDYPDLQKQRITNTVKIARFDKWFGGCGVDGKVDTNFFSAQTTVPRSDPLTLDLDGDGLETIALNTANPIMFDHNGDGVKTATAWISPDDGFLVLDRNGNGTIDSGRELFGDATLIPNGAGGTRNAVDGFEALKAQDSNGDGKVSSLDTNFAALRIWQDLNQNGISESNELFTLTSKGIAAITVAKTENSVLLPNGNVIADLGTYTKLDGTTATLGDTAQLGDIDLRVNTFISTFTDPVPLTPEAQALPNMQGSGQVRDLREAASLSPGFTTILTQFTQAMTYEARRNLIDALVKAWSETANGASLHRGPRLDPIADTSTMATTATGAYAGHPLTVTFTNVTSGTPEYTAWLDKITILERFNGRTFRVVPVGSEPVTVFFAPDIRALLDQSYNALKESVYDALFLQTRGKAYLDAIALTTDAAGNYLVDPDPDGRFLSTTIEHHDKCHRSPRGVSNLAPCVLLAA